jgi:predicted MPP superfamily phosphohydrolase
MRRRPFGLLIVLSIFVAIVGGSHDYFAQRLVRDTALPAPWSSVATWTIAALAVLLFVQPVSSRRFGPRVGGVLGWPAFTWLGTCFYLLLGLWASDVVLALAGLHGEAIARTRAEGICILVGAIVLFGMRAAVFVPAVKAVEVKLRDWPAALDGYRVVQISDVHIGSMIGRRFAERVVARCNALAPDLIAITGDLVDGSVRALAQAVEPFARLRASDGVFFVTGNHDYYSGAERWVQKVRELGIEVLRNRRVTVRRGASAFELAGVDDLSSSRLEAGRGHDLDAALGGWNRRDALLLLAHDPRTFERAHERGVSLQLSGHTHGGQLWPFGWLVRLQTKYVAGLYTRGSSTLYVSRGTGYWGPPIRVLAPAEITVLSLRPAT